MHWRIELFGGLRAHSGKETLTHFRSRKTAALLAYLAFFRGPHPREKLIEVLWPESSLDAGRNSLRVALADLRRRTSLSSESGSALSPPLLQQNRGSIGLLREVTTDVEDFEKAVDEARRALLLEARIEAYERAFALYQGALLPGFYESWIPVEEARLEAVFLHVLKTLGGYYESSGDSLRAFELAQLAARVEPLPSQARPQNASRRPASNRTVSSKTRTKGGPELLTPQKAANPSEVVAPLPAAFTRFFGREAELRQLAPRILESQTRLLTITGSGGLGKTRLALELARQLERTSLAPDTPSIPYFQHVFWVPLADTTEAQRLPEALSKILNLTIDATEVEGHKPSLLESIARFLRGKGGHDARVLLVLDNFEQLLPQGAAFLGELLERVAGLTLLVTSRQRLNLSAEWEHRIEALTLPSQNLPPALPSEGDIVWDERQLTVLRDASSVQLFADRARAARADWRLLPHEAPTLISLLHRLEGIPLAIELVASRAGVLSLGQMLSRLSKSLHWVSSRDQHRPVRHRSLHAVLEWSLQLLPAQEREIFARLSVFHGGWTLEDAISVLSDVDADTLLDVLQSLRDASLITSDENAGTGLRFSMLEIVRQLAEERLETTERLATRRRHAEFYFQLAQRSSDKAGGVEGRKHWVATEGYNFAVALDFWATEDLERALEMAAALWWYWVFDYHLPEGCHFLLALLARPESENFPVARARAQKCAAYVALLSGHFDMMDKLLEAAMAVWRSNDDKNELASTLNLFGALFRVRGDLEKSRDFYAQSLALRRWVYWQDMHSAGVQRELGIAINALAGIERDCGHFEIARRLCEEALELARQYGDRAAQAWAYHTLGFLAFDEGDLERARAYQERSIAIRRNAKHLHAEADCLDALGDVALRAGELETARAHYRQSLELWRQISQPPKMLATQKRLEAVESLLTGK